MILKNLDHRGAVGADPLQGDGAGILIQIPDQFYREEMAKQGITLPPLGEYGVGMVFLPQEAASRHACVEEIERSVKAEGQVLASAVVWVPGGAWPAMAGAAAGLIVTGCGSLSGLYS